MILDRYIGRFLLVNVLLALFVLVAIFSFFSLVDQLDDTGVGHYGVAQAIQYVLLTIPRLSNELFPIAAVIGSIAALGLLANSNELLVIRTTGLSQMQLAYSLLKSGLILVLFNLLIGELIAPTSEQLAQQKRSIAMTEQISLKTKNGFWVRDGHDYINIRKVLSDDRIEEIYIYEFDHNHHLKTSLQAAYGEYRHDRWILYDIVKTRVSEERVTIENIETIEWEALLNPDLLDLVTIKPSYLSVYGLVRYIDYLKQNNQSSRLYVQALWSKLVNPLTVIAMILLSICVVKCDTRSMSLGKRVFIGALIGILFHLLNQISGHLGIVYELPAFVSVGLPTILVLTYIFYVLKQNRN